MSTDDQLRREIDLLGRMFGEVIQRFEGEHAFQLVEQVRSLARQFANGDAEAGNQLAQLFKGFTLEELRLAVRAFSTFLELANLAEDRQRIRVLRERQAASYPRARRESLLAAAESLRDRGYKPDEVRQLLA